MQLSHASNALHIYEIQDGNSDQSCYHLEHPTEPLWPDSFQGDDLLPAVT